STTQGAIAGTVEDPSGAVVSGAAVTIRNTATNASVRVTADGSGYFNAPLLEPGTYTVTVTAQGFATYTANNVSVLVGQLTSVLPHLALSSSTAEVVVTEQTPTMNLTSPDFTDTLNTQALQTIPINNRRWSSLAMTTPGVVSDANGFGLVSIRGVSPILNNVEIDGADDNNAFWSEERGRTREAYSTSGNAVREFAVNTGVYSAEYGRAAGGVINSVTKSGTNQLHGEAYFFDRESNWATYNDYATIPTPSGTTEHIKTEDLRKIYGFTVGGPIIKDKLFWMYTYDQHTRVFPVDGIPFNPANFYTLPAAALPAGATCYLNGSTTPPPAGESYEDGYLAGDTTGTATQDAEACTLAARQNISYPQAAADWASLINGGSLSTGASDLGLSSDIGLAPRFGYQEINTPKLDWQINQRNHLSVLFHRLRWDSPGGVQTASTDYYSRDTQGNDFVKLDYGLTKLTTLITSNISNEVLYQYSRELEDENQQPYTAYTLADLNNKSGNIPEVNVAEGSSGWGFYAGSPYYSYRPAYPEEWKWQVGDVLYWNKGNHTVKFGVDAVHNTDYQNSIYESNGYYSYPYLGLYMNDLLNFKNGVALSSTAGGNYGCDDDYTEYAGQYGNGSSAAKAGSVVAGYPCYADFYQGFGTPTYTLGTMDTGVFVQDNWKFTPRLTLELGLRWDHEALPAPNPTFTAASTTTVGATTVIFAPYPGLTNHPNDDLDFGPRIGFSYDVFGRGNTVLRGGWGMYFGRITNGNLLEVILDTGSPAAQTSPTFYNAPFGSISEGPQYPAVFQGGLSTSKPSSYYFASNLKLPEVQEFDLQVQQAVGRGTFVSVSYLGSLGRRLPNFLDTNIEPCSASATACKSDTITVADASGKGPIPAGSLTINNIYTSYGNTALFGSTAGDFTSITEMTSNVNSSYNAAVAEVVNRSLKSVTFDANYTWSHALDFAQNADTEGATNVWYDPYENYRLNYGNSTWNTPNRFVAYALYNFPNMHSGNPLKWVTNDWSLDDSFQTQNGLAYTPAWSGKLSGALTSGFDGAGGLGIIPGIFGYDSARQPRTMVDDMRVQKAIPFEAAGHGYSLQLIANVFNLANHQNITSIGTTAYSLSGSTLTYLGQGSAYPKQDSLGIPSNSNSEGFLYTPREVEISARLVW
ncbi:MAG TPA: carboxypeptidase regulatory-like domain-containing protein, partial [Terracidiphilus sp.]|nr:carboxypeptidase regulatory-like domain-containing protein [Terracidiphilus sp.]